MAGPGKGETLFRRNSCLFVRFRRSIRDLEKLSLQKEAKRNWCRMPSTADIEWFGLIIRSITSSAKKLNMWSIIPHEICSSSMILTARDCL